MLSQVAKTLQSQSGKHFLRLAPRAQRRNMGGGGAFMETNKFGETVGDIFGTIAWLWVFHRFRQDGAVLLGFQHPWEHGHDDHHASSSHSSKPRSKEDITETWQKFSQKSTVPGDDDDDDDEEEEDEDDE